VKGKYKKNADKLLKLIDVVYRWLPLGTIVDKKVLVVHGGISDSTDLDWIKNIDRHKVSYFPIYMALLTSTVRGYFASLSPLSHSFIGVS